MQDKSLITFEIAITDKHFEQILALQKQNHYAEISETQQNQNGFVFASHTLPVLKKMAAQMPQVIALCGGEVIGYNLAMSSTMADILPSLLPMFEEFNKWDYEGKALSAYRFVVGGQVCVDENFRGMGLIRSLYQKTKEVIAEDFQLCITEISVRNINSLKAHQRIGFEVVGNYDDGAENWNLMVWKF